MKCIRCEEEMKIVKNGSIEIDVCMDGCGGMWFDPFELKKMNEKHEVGPDFMREVGKARRKLVDKKPRLKCPKDDATMLRHFHSVLKEVEIDQCSNCYGHWLDGGEFQKIINQFSDEKERLQVTQEFFEKLKR